MCRDCGRQNDPIGGEGEHREFGDRRALFVGQGPADLAQLVGEDDLDVPDTLAAAERKRRVGDVAAVDRHRLQNPAAHVAAGPDQMRSGLHAGERETAFLVDPRVRLRTERGLIS